MQAHTTACVPITNSLHSVHTHCLSVVLLDILVLQSFQPLHLGNILIMQLLDLLFCPVPLISRCERPARQVQRFMAVGADAVLGCLRLLVDQLAELGAHVQGEPGHWDVDLFALHARLQLQGRVPDCLGHNWEILWVEHCDNQELWCACRDCSIVFQLQLLAMRLNQHRFQQAGGGAAGAHAGQLRLQVADGSAHHVFKGLQAELGHVCRVPLISPLLCAALAALLVPLFTPFGIACHKA
mmetsp:Transcript_32435/g.71660  ORF Transcript_32435/g.71660 Transcript_32435/m.71660 type:complete len:240 (+) Transcript_32435:135-854(+)